MDQSLVLKRTPISRQQFFTWQRMLLIRRVIPTAATHESTNPSIQGLRHDAATCWPLAHFPQQSLSLSPPLSPPLLYYLNCYAGETVFASPCDLAYFITQLQSKLFEEPRVKWKWTKPVVCDFQLTAKLHNTRGRRAES